ncbi:hypothetical protein GN496_25875, partial [Salmonella enterica]|nr:hypothetical protein [Salmonella enterica]
MLDGTLVTDSNRDTLLGMHIENLTSVDMNGTAVFDDSGKTGKGWIRDFTSDDMPYGGWIFNNTTVTAGGTVDLKGVGFTNSVLNVTQGDLDINNVGGVNLSGSSVTLGNGAVSLTAGQGEVSLNNTNLSVPQGGVTVHAVTGGVDLTRGNISAKQDISLISDNGTITLKGVKQGLTSIGENGVLDTGNLAVIVSSEGNITLNGTAGNSQAISLSNAGLTANNGSITITGKSSVVFGAYNQVGAVTLMDTVEFHSLHNVISGVNTIVNGNFSIQNEKYAGLMLGSFANQLTLNVSGNTSLYGESPQRGVYFGSPAPNTGMSANSILVHGGNFSLTGKTNNLGKPSEPSKGTEGIGISFAEWDNTGLSPMNFYLYDGANVSLTGDGATHGAPGFSPAFVQDINIAPKKREGFIFHGTGNVSVTGKSVDQEGVYSGLFDNTDLTGNMNITGESDSG